MITVNKAKIILGKKYSHLTDKEIERIIVFLYNICKGVIDEVVKRKNVEYVKRVL